MYKINAEGKQFTVAILGAGNMFGEIDSFSFGTRGNYIETIEESLICSVMQERFEQFLSKRPQLALRFLKELSNRLKERDELLEKLALGDIRQRVLHLLVKLSDQFGVETKGYKRIDMAITHQEVANMIGATRESVTAALNDFVREEIIQTGRKSITVCVEKAQRFLKQD